MRCVYLYNARCLDDRCDDGCFREDENTRRVVRAEIARAVAEPLTPEAIVKALAALPESTLAALSRALASDG